MRNKTSKSVLKSGETGGLWQIWTERATALYQVMKVVGVIINITTGLLRLWQG